MVKKDRIKNDYSAMINWFGDKLVDWTSAGKTYSLNGEFGNLIAIDFDICWDIYKYPKIVDLNSGKIIYKDETIFSGRQCSSIINYIKDELVNFSYSRELKKLAILTDNFIEILSL